MKTTQKKGRPAKSDPDRKTTDGDSTAASKEGNRVTELIAKVRMTKTIKADGTVLGEAKGHWFKVREHNVETIGDLYAVLEKLRHRPKSCVIRGTLKADPPERDGDWYVRRKVNFDDEPLTWAMLDIDGLTYKELGLSANPRADDIVNAVRERLPKAFRDVDCIAQFSSKMGVRSGAVKLHLWFMLGESRTCHDLEHYCKNSIVDLTPFRVVQPHFTADPILADGVESPWPEQDRLFRLDGSHPTAIVPAAPPKAVAPELVDQDETEVDFELMLEVNEVAVDSPVTTPDGGQRYDVEGDCPLAVLLGEPHERGDGSDCVFYVGGRTKGVGFDCKHHTCINAAVDAKSTQWELLRAKGFEVPIQQDGPALVFYGQEFPALPLRLCYPGGLIDMVVDYVRRESKRDQPEVALAAGLVLIAALAGDKFHDPNRNFPTIYATVLANSGAGKGQSISAVKKILQGLGHQGVLVDKFASAAALRKALAKRPTLVANVDEFGLKLKYATENKGGHDAAIVTELLERYTTDEASYAAYSDVKHNTQVDRSYLSLFGSTTPEPFFEALTTTAAKTGLVARLSVFLGVMDHRRPSRCRIEAFVRNDVKESVQPLIEAALPLAKFSESLEVERTPAAQEYLINFMVETGAIVPENATHAALIARTDQKAMRLAVAAAISNAYDRPGLAMIGIEEMTWACEVARFLDDRLTPLVIRNSATDLRRLVDDLHDWLRKRKGKEAKLRDIEKNKFRHEPRKSLWPDVLRKVESDKRFRVEDRGRGSTVISIAGR